MAATANFASTPIVGSALITTADTSRSAPSGGGSPFFTPGANGGQCERITVFPMATVASKTVVRIFHYNGTVADLKAEIPLPPLTVTLTDAIVPIVLSAVDYPQLFPQIVSPNSSLRATVNDAQAAGVKVVGEGGAY